MFEGLKKRLSNFVDSVVSKEKTEIKNEENEQKVETVEKPVLEQEVQNVRENTTEPKTMPVHEKQEPRHEPHAGKPVSPNTKTTDKPVVKLHSHKKEINIPEVQPTTQHVREDTATENKEGTRTHESKTHTVRQEKKPTVGTGTKLKGILFNKVHLKESDIDPFISVLRMGLLESDVNYDVADKLADEIKKDMLSKSISARSVDSEIRQMIRESIKKVLAKSSGTDLLEIAKSKKAAHDLPFKILFIGPNGAGKTTTMAKMANMFITNGFTCVLSASDTFRAAAIEQTTFHADKLGIRVVKGAYGSDPASIAFDAIAHAKAHNVDVVLMDSAGRQETNKSLVEELKKMSRVTKPDLKIFIGESIAGNSLLDQVKALNEAVNIDGIILTKLDCDAKGGNTLSLLSELDIPILFFGIGEKYNDIIPYDPDFIIDNILPNN